MKIYFGVNEFELVPGFDIPGVNYQYIDQFIDIQILADEVSLGDMEQIIADKDNLASIRVLDEENQTTTYFDGYTKIANMQKQYNIVYSINQEDNVELQPAIIDPNTNEVIQQAVYGTGLVEQRADIIYLRLNREDLMKQVNENTANIEFIAIMSDIEL